MKNENQNIEWKENWRDEYLKWVCGFANAKGGKIFIGKNDSGEIVGLDNAKRLMEDIPNKIQTQLGIICDVDLKEENNKQYLEIDVKPYDVPIAYHGKYYYRSGSTKQELRGNALNNFLLKKSGKTWDDVIESRTSIDDIDVNAVEAFKIGAQKSGRMPFIKVEKEIEQILDNLLLLENKKLKRAAVLLFGKNPCRFYINAFVKIGRFGKTDDDLLFQEIIEGNAYQLADQTLEILDKKFLISPISYEGLQRIEKWEYPYEAIREAVINAIVHKDYMGTSIQISVYDDKIIIWNEGTLPDDLTIEDLKRKHSSRPHNPILASAFFKGGLIEAWGRGTLKIIKECKKAGLPEPIIEKTSGGISVTIQKKETVTKPVTGEVDGEHVKTDHDTPQVTPQVTHQVAKLVLVLTCEMKRVKLQDLLNLKDKKHFNKIYLHPAIKQGLIEMTIPDKPNSRFQKYRLTEKGKKLKRKLKKEYK